MGGIWLHLVVALFALLGASSSLALTPPMDNRPSFFSGDWIGTGTQDMFCFIRLQQDGHGTVLVSGASGDWLGARIRWRNQHQSMLLMEVSPLPAEPGRRLMPLSRLTLHSGINQTLQLQMGEHPVCELQLHNKVLRSARQAEMLIDNPTEIRTSNSRK